MSPPWDVIVIGGGAAGLWAAGTAALRGRRTLALEKNRKAGAKILISGGTRCNITHACGARAIVAAFGEQGKFLHSALARLSPQDVVATIESFGVATKVESSGKVFPRSNRAIDVRDALVRRLTQAGGHLHLGTPVQTIDVATDAAAWLVQLPDQTLTAASVIVACGGKSYPGCGTTGDGYQWLESFGHHIVPTRPALTPLCSSALWLRELQGITLADAGIRVGTSEPPGEKKSTRRDARRSDRNGLLFTHFGLSGPAPMNVSRYVDATIDHVQLDLLPAQPADHLQRLLIPNGTRGKLRLAGVLRELLPRRLVEIVLTQQGLEESRPLAELGRSSRASLVSALKTLSVPISGTQGFAKAEVTAGGVDLREVNPRTMESLCAPGLYCVGEILDLDGPIGGYNFQAAFSTGHAAGCHA